MTLRRLNARTDHRQPLGAVREIVLIVIEHPDFDEPVRLSTDPTERLSVEPELTYGTRSSWRMLEGERAEFSYVVVGYRVPDDSSGAPAATQLSIEAPDGRLGEKMIATFVPAVIHMAMVTLDDPDRPERQWTNLELRRAPIAGSDIAFDLECDPSGELPFPAQRKTPERFRGMHP